MVGGLSLEMDHEPAIGALIGSGFRDERRNEAQQAPQTILP
jgi:hypothetical protein